MALLPWRGAAAEAAIARPTPSLRRHRRRLLLLLLFLRAPAPLLPPAAAAVAANRGSSRCRSCTRRRSARFRRSCTRSWPAAPHGVGNPGHVLAQGNGGDGDPHRRATLDDDYDDVHDENDGDDAYTSYSCPLSDSAMSSICLFNPCKASDQNVYSSSARPLLIYVPGMDCTGQGISTQVPSLSRSGYDVRCVYIPSSDRSSWEQLVKKLIPLLKKEKFQDGIARDITLLGESFGGALALRLAQSAPNIISRLVLVNPATNFQASNPTASVLANTGLIAMFPEFLYETAQDILLPLMVNWDRVKLSAHHNIFSPIDFVPPACASWRVSLLNDNTGLDDAAISSIKIPTLLLSSAEDHVLSSIEECGRLQKLLSCSKRVILPSSGHTALLEDEIDVSSIMEMHGFSSTTHNTRIYHGESMRKDLEKDENMDDMGKLIRPWRTLTAPLVSGEENLPSPQLERPILFVGNHTLFGFYDTPLLFYELYLRGFRCRGLAHPGHWKTGMGQLFERYGHVKATKMGAYKLLKEKEHVLLFPGGASEVYKRKGEEYKLLWKPTVDFVRMAKRFDTIIVPFATLGGDDAYKIIYDRDDILDSPFGPLVKEVYKRLDISLDAISPITALPGTSLPSLIPVPNIERLYFHFAKPIDTAEFKAISNDQQYEEMYSMTKQRVEESITLLKELRVNDKANDLPTRLIRKVSDLLPSSRGHGE